MVLRCIQCGFPVEKLYRQYSPGNIRLIKCEQCHSVADEYIECEIMILLIDLILHKKKAYRHLIFNTLNQESINVEGLLWKSTFGYLLLDAYMALVLSRSEQKGSSSTSYSLHWGCGKVLMAVSFGNIMFICTFLLAKRVFVETAYKLSRYKDFLLAILVSSYFKIFLIAMMVWEFPISVIFIINIFVLSSNTVALKVITEAVTCKCIAVCFAAHAAKILTNLLLIGHHPGRPFNFLL